MSERETDVASTDPGPPTRPDTAAEIAKRIYLYAIAALSLVLLSLALTNLLELAFTRIASNWQDGKLLVAGIDDVRRQVSVQVALLLVTLPFWLVHWLLIERSLSRNGSERGSAVRAIYLALALTIPLIYLIGAVRDLSYRLFWYLTDATGPVYGHRTVSEALALLLVAGGVWGYHAWIRRSDLRHGSLPYRALWPGRAYVYSAAFVGVLLLLNGVIDLLGVAVSALIGNEDLLVDGGRWWAPDLSNGLAAVVAGLLLWCSHWGYALRIVRDIGWLGQSERRSALRRVYLYLVAFVGMGLALLTMVRILDILLQQLLDAYPDTGELFSHNLLESLLRLVPFGVVWLYHRRRILLESAVDTETAPQQNIRRSYTYGAAFIGLVFAAIGVAQLLALTIDELSAGGQLVDSGDTWRRDVCAFLAIVIVGTAVWLWHWFQAQRWVAQSPGQERATTVRRIYLFGALGAAAIAALGGLAIIVYRLLTILLDVSDRGDFFSESAVAIGLSITALGVAAYHGLVLREDFAAQPVADRRAQQRLILSAPPDTDLDPIIADLREHLPDGFELRRD